ncbi:hypothetical protein LIER_28462 [Lithospermum erythrorhizon]|uniref:Uncharacterized protein n=1 Tax=Lithospermum erythrorhizon TaxID=34254 RepID=A0AAV3RIY3_LITER
MAISSEVQIRRSHNNRSTSSSSLWYILMKNACTKAGIKRFVANRQKSNTKNSKNSAPKKMNCSCSPSKHPGAFKCGYHRSAATIAAKSTPVSTPQQPRFRANLGLSRFGREAKLFHV